MIGKIGNRMVALLSPLEKPYDVWDTELKGFLIRVLPSGKSSYFVSYRREDGRRTRISLGSCAAVSSYQARDEAKIVLGKVAQGIDPVKERRRKKAMTLRHFLKDRFSPWAKTNRKSGTEMVQRIESCFPDLLDKQLTEISAWVVEKWRVTKKNRGISPQTINKDIACLSSALTRATHWEIIERHPLRSLKPLKAENTSYIRYLSAEEEIRLRSALDERELELRKKRESFNQWLTERGEPALPFRDGAFADHLKPMVLVSLNTGMRRGEVFGLRWTDINFGVGTLTIRGENAKSGKTRHIPLNTEALDVLKAWKEQAKDGATALVFPNFDGERFDSNKSSWKTLLVLSRIENFRWHDMRHHFASRLVMLGVDLNTVRELLGHSDLKMTLRYSHLSPQVKAAAVEKLCAEG